MDDAGSLFAVPWCSGTSSIAYNPDYVDFEIEHWSDLLDPRLKGHVMVLNGDGDSWVIGCLLAGEDSNDIENADIEKVRASLNELKGQLLGFWSTNDEQIMPWMAGDFWAGEIWSGPYSQLLHDSSTNIKLVHPEEGYRWLHRLLGHRGRHRRAGSGLRVARLDHERRTADLHGLPASAKLIPVST